MNDVNVFLSLWLNLVYLFVFSHLKCFCRLYVCVCVTELSTDIYYHFRRSFMSKTGFRFDLQAIAWEWRLFVALGLSAPPNWHVFHTLKFCHKSTNFTIFRIDSFVLDVERIKFSGLNAIQALACSHSKSRLSVWDSVGHKKRHACFSVDAINVERVFYFCGYYFLCDVKFVMA